MCLKNECQTLCEAIKIRGVIMSENNDSRADEILKKFAGIANNPYEEAIQWKKENNGRVIGCCGMHFPEELIHAAGCLPVILQENEEIVTQGHAYYYPFFCGFTRSIIDQGAKGYLNFLDAVLAGDYCVQEVGAGEVFGVLFPKKPNLFFRLPMGNQEWTHADLTQGLVEIRQDIEKFIGTEISDESIRESIRIYNLNRSYLRKIYEMRLANPGILSAWEMISIVKSSMVMLKQDHNKLMADLIKTLDKRKVSRVSTNNGLKVFLSGSFCGAPKRDILFLIEQSGATVVNDDIYHGYRYISTDINESDASPLSDIARWYLNKNAAVPCPTRCDPHNSWTEYLLNAMKKNKADRLVILTAQYCEPHLFFYPDIKEVMEEAGIPHILLEMEHEVVSLESLRTRVEAFMELGI